MVKADLHVHSSFSAHPSEWFLQRLGTRESYSEPEVIYHEARKRGMSFVTITDHNEINASLLLKEKYPHRVITGVEATTYFPESGCKIHLLVYGLTESQFRMINMLRSDIYELREYLREQRLAHAVAHPTFSINQKLTVEHIERLLLLFDYFEGINGSRSRFGNEVFMDIISAITPEIIDDLFSKYHIEPYSDSPWIKGTTGGSDDHSGLFVGKTYTCAKGETPELFIEQLKNKHSFPAGRHNDYQGLAFAIYKIAYEFSKRQSRALSSPLFHSINQLIFEQKSMDFKSKLMVKKMKFSREVREDKIKRLFFELVDTFQKQRDVTVEAKLAVVYERISAIADEFFKALIMGIEQDLHRGDIISLIKNISGSIPGIFLSLPFFTTVNMLHGSRAMLNELSRVYGCSTQPKRKRVLWFTDGISGIGDRNSPFMNLVGFSHNDTLDGVVVTCLPPGKESGESSYTLINLPAIYTYTPSFLSSDSLRFPSLLASLKMIYEADPDEVFIATPGPVGLLGLLTARLLHVHCTGIYHADSIQKVKEAINDEKVCRAIEDFTRWFYSSADTIGVSSQEDMSTLEACGYHREKMFIVRKSQNRDDFDIPKRVVRRREKGAVLPVLTGMR